MFILKVIREHKIYRKVINYLCSILGLKYQLFNRKALLKLNYKVEISKKKNKIIKRILQRNFLYSRSKGRDSFR